VASAVAQTERGLREAAPDLLPGFRAALPHAIDLVARRVLGTACREGLAEPSRAAGGGDRVSVPRIGRGNLVLRMRRHAFDRLECDQPVEVDPVQLLADLTGDAGPVAAELADATVNLAIALARRQRLDADSARVAAGVTDSLDLAARYGRDADERCAFLEQLATEGHNLHPCARTRLGWDVRDVLAHDLESPGTALRMVGVRRDLHVGDDVGAEVARRLGFPLPSTLDLDRFALAPVHEWQYERVLRHRYADLFASGAFVPIPGSIAATATAALRTLLLRPAPGVDGNGGNGGNGGDGNGGGNGGGGDGNGNNGDGGSTGRGGGSD
jgi:siderophore synthetase component